MYQHWNNADALLARLETNYPALASDPRVRMYFLVRGGYMHEAS